MKILHIDIETLPHTGYFWGLGKTTIGAHQISVPGRVVCFAAKWEDGDETMFYTDWWGRDSERLARMAWQLLDEADAVVHFNGTRFDLPRLYELMLQHGLGPPSPVQEIDLLDTVRRRFSFPSNRLEYVVRALDLGAKLDTGGFELWKTLMEGSADEKAVARKRMRRYNIRDVKLQQKLYRKLRPWLVKHPNHALYGDGPEGRPMCPTCGSYRVQYRGWFYTSTQRYRRLHCQACKKWSRERTTAVPKEARPNILTGL